MIDIVDLLGQPAISLRTAEQTGIVKGLRFERDRVISIDIGEGRTIPVESVRSFEGDALTYEDESVPTDRSGAEPEPGQLPLNDKSRTDDEGRTPGDADTLAGELPLPHENTRIPWHGNPIGTLLLSDTGDSLGTLEAMQINAAGVVIEIADDHGHTYAGDRLMTVGRFATIIAHRGDESS